MFSCWGKLIVKALWTVDTDPWRGGVGFWPGGIGREYLGQDHCEAGTEEEAPQLCGGISPGPGTCSDFQEKSLSWMLFFFFPILGFFGGMLAVIIQFHPKIYVFNGSVRMDIEVFMFPVSNSSYYMLQQWKFIWLTAIATLKKII